MSVRICHIADFHLGGQLTYDEILSAKIKKNLILGLDNLIKMLNQSKVDLLLIAGDFFETSSQNLYLLKDVKEILSGFDGKIVLSPGNHDYVSVESYYNEKWPDNMYIFKKEDIDYFQFDDLNTRIYGMAFNHSHIYERKMQLFREIDVDDKYINIGLFHGQVENKLNSYNPIYLEDIENSNMNYIALGHIHNKSEIKRVGKTYYAYSGNPIARGFDELGPKGVYLGEVDKNFVKINFYKLLDTQFVKMKVDIKDFSSSEIISKQVLDNIKNIYGNTFKKNYYYIEILGYRQENEYVNIDLIKSSLEEFEYIELVDKTKIRIDYEIIRKEKNLYGIFVDNVLNSDFPIELKEEILDIGIRAFEDLL